MSNEKCVLSGDLDQERKMAYPSLDKGRGAGVSPKFDVDCPKMLY